MREHRRCVAPKTCEASISAYIISYNYKQVNKQIPICMAGSEEGYVSEEDLERYLAKSPSERSREIPVGVFSSRKEKFLPLEMGGRDHNNVNIVLTNNERELFLQLLEKRMEIYPDAMDINRVAKITDYSRTTILRRVQNGDMFSVMMNDEYVISKAGVIEFFASDKAFRIYNKSKWHKQIIGAFTKNGLTESTYPAFKHDTCFLK